MIDALNNGSSRNVSCLKPNRRTQRKPAGSEVNHGSISLDDQCKFFYSSERFVYKHTKVSYIYYNVS